MPKPVNENNTPGSRANWADLLVAAGHHKDAKAFQLLFERFKPQIGRHLGARGVDQAIIDDVIQDTMMTVWRKGHTYDPAKATASTWILRVANNRLIDLGRRAKVREASDEGLEYIPDEGRWSAEDLVAMDEHTRLVRKAIGTLSPTYRETLHLHMHDECTHSEIAEVQGVPLGTVKSRISHAKAKVAKALIPMMEAPAEKAAA